MTDIEIGRGKTGRRAYSLDEIGIVPARRTRDPEEVSIAWQIDAYRFQVPLIACPMDSVVSPATAIAIGKLGGLGVLDLEGLWTRFDEPEPLLAEVTELGEEAATKRLQEIYAEPIKDELIGRRIEEISRAGVVTAAALSPQRTARYYKAVLDAGADIFVIRGTTVSAEHVSGRAEPLNLKQFIYELDIPVIVGGCATYTAALHLMRTGAAGDVLRAHRGAPDHEDVRPGVHDGLVVTRGALRRQPGGGDHAGPADLLDPAADQLFPDRLGVDLLQPPGGRFFAKLRHLSQQRLRIFEPGPQALEVEHGETAQLADRDGRRGRDHAVHRAGDQRKVEPVGVDLPGDRHFLRVARPARGDDAYLVKRVRPAPGLATPDLYVCHCVPFGSLSSGRCSSAPRPSSARRAGGFLSGLRR